MLFCYFRHQTEKGLKMNYIFTMSLIQLFKKKLLQEVTTTKPDGSFYWTKYK